MSGPVSASVFGRIVRLIVAYMFLGAFQPASAPIS
jgi:hypothetical protein